MQGCQRLTPAATTKNPEFRKHAGYTAYVEGWTLSSERLAHQMGCYQDSYTEYARLENEMWRDIGLVWGIFPFLEC